MKTAAQLEAAKKRLEAAWESDKSQRKREADDLKAQLPENQWTEAAKAARAGGEGKPPRPMLSVSLVRHPMQLARNQIANAQLGVNVHPVGENSSKEWAEIRQELYRRIERDSNAVQARLWAVDRALKCGRGWYRVDTKWDEESESDWFQEIVIRRILHQDSVLMDPAAEEADYSDAMRGWVLRYLPLDDFRKLYPKAAISDDDFKGLMENAPMWVRMIGEQQAVLTVEQYEKERVVREVITHPKDGRKRELIDVKVTWSLFTGAECLDEQPWAGRHIPLIPVLGEELQPIDGERIWEGMYRPAKDAQTFFNSAITAAVESIWMEPKAPFVLDPKQIEGYERYWDGANTEAWPYLPANLIQGENGKFLPPPMRSQRDQSGTSISMMAVELARTLGQMSTSIYDPGLGKDDKDAKSGRAILALQQQGDAGTSHYAWNMTNTSMTYEARVGLDLMPKVYDSPGRITTVIGGEDDERQVMLGVPFVVDPETGRPRQVPEGTPGAKFYDLSHGKYSVSVSIGRSYQTRLQEGAEFLADLVPNLPPELQVILLPVFMRFLDKPGAVEAADLLKKYRAHAFPYLRDEDEQPSAEESEAKAAQLEQKLGEMNQLLQQAMQKIETDQAKQQATLEKASLDAETKLRLEQMQAQHEAALQALKLQAEAIQAALDRTHEQRLKQQEMAHEVALAAAQGQSMTMTRTDGQEREGQREQEQSQGQSREASSEAQSAPEGE